ncbi:M48 family metalloprotease [Deinococcus arcticus]|uniref:Peptidase M48 n=1 Tax=Deinococcus arcticus TaxID=2136176 RepID=A0A2T3W734_9DEIO|nr:M48 family metallopeptidase [Deinococcus arcticus]PTA67710.1 peptidase M48 [Deinococcus arcticus]
MTPDLAPQGALDRAWQRVADREAARLRDLFAAHPAPILPARAALARILAALILLGSAALTLLGLWLLLRALGLGGVSGGARVTSGLGAAPLLLFTWVARPRVPRVEGTPLPEAQAPQLHALVRRVGEAVGVTRPVHMVLSPDANAFMGLHGPRRTPVLGLGLALWYGLRPQERVALIAHELAHLKNGDPTRGGVVQAALNVLHQTVSVLWPDPVMEARAGLPEKLGNLILKGAALLPLGLIHLLLGLVGADQQAAEYRADLLAAQVAGSEAKAGLLDRLHMAHLLDSALHKQRHQPQRPDAFAEFRHMLDTLPPAQWAQVREEHARLRVRLDGSHPPTADRLRVVQAWPSEPLLTLSPEDAARLDAELQPFVAALEAAATEEYLYRTSG